MPTALDPTATPYVGPRTFSRAQSHLFFGREAEARDLLARAISERLLLFYAQSGAGKSSLINARLIPQLEAEGFTVLPVGRVSGELPAGAGDVGNIFLFNLMLSLDQAPGAPARLAGLSLSDFLAGLTTADGAHWTYDPGATAVHASQPAEPSPTETRLPAAPAQRFVLVIDQFEEIITAHPGRWQEREGFFRQLAAALQADPNQWIVLTLREDYVAALDPYAHLLYNRLRARFYMERMGVDAALDAIRRPAELGGRPFAPGVAEQLADNLRLVRVPGQEAPIPGQYVEPVQLQVVCYQLWENLGKGTEGIEGTGGTEGTEITLDDLAEAGDVNRALTQFYEETLAAALADPAAAGVSERQLRTWFDEELITDAGTRGLVRQGEQNTGSSPNAAVRRLQERFLVHGETRSGDTWIELVHDSFIEPIRRSNRAWFNRNLNPLTVAARAWQDASKDATKLYTGSQLVDASAQLAAHPADFGELEQEFVAAGQEAQRQRAARRQRTINRGAAALLVIFAALTAWALWSRDQAQQAQRTAERETSAATKARETAEAAKAKNERLTRIIRADQLTANGFKVLDENPPLALLLGVEGVKVQRDHSETVVASAQFNLFDLLRQTGGTPLVGHEREVVAVAFSPDRRWLATASADGTARLWDVANPTAAASYTLTGHANRVNAVAFSPDSRWLATASQDKTARLWDVANPAAAPRVLAGHADAVSAVAFSPDGRWLATASDDRTARLWDLTDLTDPTAAPRARVLEGHTARVSAVAFSQKSRWLATASDDKTARLWDLTDLTDPTAAPRARVLKGHTERVSAVAFSFSLDADSRWLATASDDKTARLWDLKDPTAAPRILEGHTERVSAVAFSPDGYWLATASNDKTARLWEVANPVAEPRVLAGHESVVNALTISLDSRWLATASNDKTARLWDLKDPTAEPRVLAGHAERVSAVAFSPNSRWLATASDDTTARLWEVVNPTAAPTVLAGHAERVSAVAFSPNSRWLATASWDTTARLWEVANPTAAPTVLAGHTSYVTAVAFSPDGRWLATASYDKTVRLWEVADPVAARHVLEGHTDVVTAVAFSPDGRWLATASYDKTVRLWEVADPVAARHVLEGHTDVVSALAFSPDGRWLATASYDKTVRLWEVADPAAEPGVLVGHESPVVAVAFSPDGRWLATASWDNTARLWDVANFPAAPRVLAGHTNGVMAVAFSSDGLWLATASGDKTVRLWEVANSTAAPRGLAGHTGPVNAIAFSPDGRWLATTDGTVRLWPWGVENLTDLACATAGRNMSQEEGQRYLADQLTYKPTCAQWPEGK